MRVTSIVTPSVCRQSGVEVGSMNGSTVISTTVTGVAVFCGMQAVQNMVIAKIIQYRIAKAFDGYLQN
jgi:hypothetical protein